MIGTSLYRFFDADDRLLYVGITSVGPNRWTEHEANRPWWADVRRTSVEHFPDRATAIAAEQDAIRSEKPLHNVKHVDPPRGPRQLVSRAKGTGTIVQRPNGQWTVAVTIRGSRRIFRKFDLEDDARLFLAAFEYRNATFRARRQAIEVLEAGGDWNPPKLR